MKDWENWRPIETAPRGVAVLVFNETGRIEEAVYMPDAERWVGIGGAFHTPPTHWLPLPLPPHTPVF